MVDREEHESEEKVSNVKSSTETDMMENAKASSWNGSMKNTLNNNEILSQALLFLAAGFETTSTSLEFFCYNLATHPEVQDKLIEEVDRVLENYVNIYSL